MSFLEVVLDMTVNSWILLGIGALILAGWLLLNWWFDRGAHRARFKAIEAETKAGVKLPMQLNILRAQICREAKTVGVKAFSHNIISSALRQIAKEHGDIEANKAISDFRLERLGWSYKVCEHCGHWPCGCGG